MPDDKKLDFDIWLNPEEGIIFKVKYNSPSLDKIIPKKGYTKNNISVISYRANTIKSDGRLDEFVKIYKYMVRKMVRKSTRLA